MKYVVKLGWSDSDHYEFKNESSAAAWNFAELAATHVVDKNKKVEVELVPDEEDLVEVEDESEVENNDED